MSMLYLIVVVLVPLLTIFLCEYAIRSRSRAEEKANKPKPQKDEARENVALESAPTPDVEENASMKAAATAEAPKTEAAMDDVVVADAAQVNRENTSNGPSIVIAYATGSRNSLTLAHKLFSAINTTLFTKEEQQQQQQQASTCVDCCCSKPAASAYITPNVRILELREEEEDQKGERSASSSASSLTVEDLLEKQSYAMIIFVASTFTDGTAPPRSQAFEAVLKDAFEDHRVSRSSLAHKRLAVFGLGDVAYGEANFNAFAKHLHAWCKGLGAPAFVVPPVYASEQKVASLFAIFSAALLRWIQRANFKEDGSIIVDKRRTKKDEEGGESMKSSCVCMKASEDGEGGDDVASESGSDGAANADDDDVDDVEDLGWDDNVPEVGEGGEAPELLYPKLRANLTKQGYHLIGSHSGVKLCRWTKSMLRGRGGCYKHTFYNINSSQCMEMTPSLACANKCIFCWRHHTNPVSREFRWRQDPPEMLIEKGMAGHYHMIKQMRGVPGVTPERLEQAMHIRHCALSLVGEPIMYPQINAFCDLLHENHISSFMVTNAQFPDQLRDLKPVVQLYLSIDAPTPDELKRVDRPLFEDYWERCLACVRELKKKKQRTVFRLTLVNDYNTENVAAYADLVDMGWPDFIEVKGVTYCGTSNSSTLTMKKNVPRHDEVVRFCLDLCAELRRRHPNHQAATVSSPSMEQVTAENGFIFIPEEERQQPYHVVCEHEHSCCMLIALDKFYQNHRWHTWIDYEGFYKLIESGETDFTSLDYALPTPAWATFRSMEQGFDPDQTRVRRGKARPVAPVALEEAA